MVRYLVGTMVEVARGRRAPGEVRALLDGSRPGLETSAPAPPQGLFLSEVEYPEGVWDGGEDTIARGLASMTNMTEVP
jgi:tRNA pseudouridine38-40 synthase